MRTLYYYFYQKNNSVTSNSSYSSNQHQPFYFVQQVSSPIHLSRGHVYVHPNHAYPRHSVQYSQPTFSPLCAVNRKARIIESKILEKYKKDH